MERLPQISRIATGLAVAAAVLGVMEVASEPSDASEHLSIQREEVAELHQVPRYSPEYIAMKVSQLIERDR